MKTVVSISDKVFKDAERLARWLGKNRSELYAQAVIEYCVRHDPDAVTEAMDRVAAQIGTQSDSFASTAARRVLGRSEW